MAASELKFPVLLYHSAAAAQSEAGPRAGRYGIAARQLHLHLRLIRHWGYRVSLLGELWGEGGDRERGPAPVALTFDDGRAADYEVAYPLLAQAGLGAEFFVNTATVGAPGFLDWPRMREMQRTGMSFQSHGHDHLALPALPRRRLEHQVRESKRRLEDGLGRPVEFLAVPYGLTSGRVVEVARQEGYRAVCTSRAWRARPGAATVNRIVIYRHTTPPELWGLLAGDPFVFAPRLLRSAVTHLPGRVLRAIQSARRIRRPVGTVA